MFVFSQARQCHDGIVWFPRLLNKTPRALLSVGHDMAHLTSFGIVVRVSAFSHVQSSAPQTSRLALVCKIVLLAIFSATRSLLGSAYILWRDGLAT